MDQDPAVLDVVQMHNKKIVPPQKAYSPAEQKRLEGSWVC